MSIVTIYRVDVSMDGDTYGCYDGTEEFNRDFGEATLWSNNTEISTHSDADISAEFFDLRKAKSCEKKLLALKAKYEALYNAYVEGVGDDD